MERICIFCVHWYFTSGEPDWSTLTPGSDFSSGCDKNHWSLSTYEAPSREQYRDKLLSARDCSDFQDRKEG